MNARLFSLPSLGAIALALGVAPAGAASPSPVPSAAKSPAGPVVHIKDFRFDPTPVTVKTGQRVTFINDDDEAHTVTATDKSFDSEGLDGGQSWQHVFTKPGTYAYYCELHPYMKAVVIVKGPKEDHAP